MISKRQLGSEIQETKRIIEISNSLIGTKVSILRQLQRGGFSEGVFEITHVQEYLNGFQGNCFGFFGQDRPKSLDRWIEKNWKGTKYELGKFLCTKAARYFSEEKTKTEKLLETYRKNFISDES